MVLLVSLIANPVVGYASAVLIGFALGRIKNAGKLARIKLELEAVEQGAIHTVESLYEAIKKHI